LQKVVMDSETFLSTIKYEVQVHANCANSVIFQKKQNFRAIKGLIVSSQ